MLILPTQSQVRCRDDSYPPPYCVFVWDNFCNFFPFPDISQAEQRSPLGKTTRWVAVALLCILYRARLEGAAPGSGRELGLIRTQDALQQ